MTRQETAKLLLILRTIWPELSASDDTVTAWSWTLDGFPYATVEEAAKRYLRVGKFAPRPSDLLELIATDTVAPDLVVEAAWAEVMAEVKRCGYNRPRLFHNGQWWDPPTPQWSSPLIAGAVAAIGWAELCTSEKPEIVRAQFIKALTALRDRAVKQVQAGDAPALPAGISALPEGGA